MSIQLMASVWKLEITANEKLVLLALADHANKDGVCWPSVGTLARKCSLSGREVQRCLKSLQESALLYKDFRSGHSTKYRLKIGVTNSHPSVIRVATDSHVPATNGHDRPRPIVTQKLPLESSRNAGSFLEEEELVICPETQTLLDQLYSGIKRI